MAEATTDLAAALAGADLVVLATPVGSFAAVGEAIGPLLKKGTIVTDVGSVKQATLRDIGPHLPDGVHLIPGHPVAGTEHSGPEAGFASLFQGRWCILTPPPGADRHALERVTEMWRRAGSTVEIMDANHHDRVLAITSHLPHLIAYTIVGTASDLEEDTKSEVIKFSAGGFRDFTRIAASDPVMWRDVFSQQPRGGAGDPAALHRGSDRAPARHPLGRGRAAAGPFHQDPRDPAGDHRRQAGVREVGVKVGLR